MKKLLMAVAAFGMLLASCAKDDTVAPVEDKEALVSFCVNSPAVATRYGEGETATTLQWAVYDKDNGHLTELDGSKNFTLSTTVDLRLIQGRKYEIIFWADNDAAPYTIAWGDAAADATMTIDYKQLMANQEEYDAFFKYEDLDTVNGALSRTVELTRPFAQLNIGTADTDAAADAGFSVAKTQVKVSNIYSTLNLATGLVSNPVETTFKLNEKADGDIVANGKTYKNIAMNYLLVGPEQAGANGKKLVNVDLTINDEGLLRSYTSVPVERNYRTNIVGNILTSPAEFNVVILPGFTDDNYEEWDGTTQDEPTLVDGVYQISHAAELAWAIAHFNKSATLNLNLEADINFGGHQLPATAGWAGLSKLNIEGNGNTIYNFTDVYTNTRAAGERVAALFPAIGSAKVNNLIIDGANVDAGKGKSAYAGVLFGSTYGTIELNNVTIKNSTVKGTNKIGAFIGNVTEGRVIANNCRAIDNTLETHDFTGDEGPESGSAGGFIGYINQNDNTFTNCSVEGGKMTFINGPKATKRANSKFIGVVSGSGTISLNNCSVDVDDYTDNCGSYVSVYGDLVGGNRGSAKVKIDGESIVSQSTLDTQAKQENAVINLSSGKYTMPAEIADNVTIVGSKNTTLTTPSEIKAKNITVKNAKLKGSTNIILNFTEEASGTFENCDIIGDVAISGTNNESLKFKDCVINGRIATQIDVNGDIEFDNCEISGWNAIGGTGEVVINNTTFGYSEQYNHLRLYNMDKAELNNCTFDPNYTIDVKGINGQKKVDVVFNDCGVANNVMRSTESKKLIELLDLSVLKKYTAASYVIDGTRVNSTSIIISTAEELIATTTISKNQSVILVANIDLNGKEFGGLSAFNPENNNTFDGMGFVVSNWTYNGGTSDMGFIKSWVGPIKNVTIENASLKTGGRSAILAGKVYSDIKNCHIVDCTLEDTYWASGLLAGMLNSGSVYNCTVTDSSIKCNGGTGAIVGVLNESSGTRGFYNCKVSGTTVNNTGVYGEGYCAAFICGMINISNSTVEFDSCSLEGNTKEGQFVGDLYYAAGDDITIVEK